MEPNAANPLEVELPAGVVGEGAFNGAKAVILMPVLYAVEPEAMESLWIAGTLFDRSQLRFMAHELTCVWESRNYLAHRYLATDAPYAIMIDGDMGLPCGRPEYYRQRLRNNLPDRWAAQNVFTRLLSHPPSMGIVGAAYFDRKVGQSLQCSKGVGTHKEPGFNERFRAGQLEGLIPCHWVGTGCVRIARWVFEKIAANASRFPEIIAQDPNYPIGYFTPAKVRIGEDVSFCLRAAALGIQSYVDTELRCMHKGATFF